MAILPFGYRFEITSPSPPAEVEAAIRSRWKTWLDPKDGARGWIAGSFICLWSTAWISQGPLLVGRISSDNFGTRISGRAGSDLNGLILILPIFLLLLLFVGIRTASGVSGRADATVLGLFTLFSALALWSKHGERKAADILIRFLNDAVTPSGRANRAKLTGVRMSDGLRLTVDDEDYDGPVTAEAIYQTLLEMQEGDLVVLRAAPETAIEAECENGAFRLEMRRGDPPLNFRAVRRNADAAVTGAAQNSFTFEETLAVFLAHGSGTQMPQFVTWEAPALTGNG